MWNEQACAFLKLLYNQKLNLYVKRREGLCKLVKFNINIFRKLEKYNRKIILKLLKIKPYYQYINSTFFFNL